jgi:hypothetical protein
LTVSLVPRLLNKDQAAAYMGTSTGTIDRLVNHGHLSLVKFPVSRSRHRETSRTFLLDRVEMDEVIAQWREKRAL